MKQFQETNFQKSEELVLKEKTEQWEEGGELFIKTWVFKRSRGEKSRAGLRGRRGLSVGGGQGEHVHYHC